MSFPSYHSFDYSLFSFATMKNAKYSPSLGNPNFLKLNALPACLPQTEIPEEQIDEAYLAESVHTKCVWIFNSPIHL